MILNFRNKEKNIFIFVFFFSLFFISLVSTLEIGETNVIGVSVDAPPLPQSFFMPLNQSVFGNFSFNGVCLDGGIELRDDGTICGQALEVFNITSVNVTKQNVTVLENFIVDGDVIPQTTNTDSIGTLALRWLKGWFSGIDISGNLNQTNGNATINMIYGNLNGHDAGLVVIDTQATYVNITNISVSRNNGFIFNSSGQGELTAQFDGIYTITSSWSFSGQANTEYHIAVGINWVRNLECHAERVIGTGGDVGDASISPCTIQINADDKINLLIENVDGTQNAVISGIGLNILRVGN